MYNASDLISALLERPRSKLWFRASDTRPAGEFPPGWRAWFAAMREHVDAVRGATADAIVAIFLGRELSRPGPCSPLLNDWQAWMFKALSDYYDSNLIANLMAPMFPEQSRNTLWVLKQA